MAVNRLKPPKNLHIEFKPSPRQYELWKLLQPNYCPHCGGEIEQILVGYDPQRNPQYKVEQLYKNEDPKTGALYSDNGCLMVLFNGFKHAAACSNDIESFLNS